MSFIISGIFTFVILSLQCTGTFGEGAVVAEHYVEWLKDYCQAFYYGLVVKLLPPVTFASTVFKTHNLQLHAG